MLTPRSSWAPWHRKYDHDYRDAGFGPKVVQRASGVANLLGLVAAGVGITRLAQSAHSIRRTGVVFVPLVRDLADTVMAWHSRHDKPAVRNLLDVVTDLASTTDLTKAG